jgi:hypothetical protein
MLLCTIVLAAAMIPPCDYAGLTSDPRLSAWVGGWCEIEVHYNYTNNHDVAFARGYRRGFRDQNVAVSGKNGLGRRCLLAVAAYHVGLARYEKFEAVRAVGLAAMQNKWHAKYCTTNH